MCKPFTVKFVIYIKKIVLFFVCVFAFACKESNSIESERTLTCNSFSVAKGIVMNADSIKPPIVILAKPGKTIHVGLPNVKHVDSNNEKIKELLFMQNFTTSNGLAIDVITDEEKSALCDKNGNLWFATGGGGASRYDGKNFTNFTTDHGLIDNIVRSIAEDRQGNIWFGTNNGVSCYNGRSFTNFTTANGLINNTVRSITTDKYQNLWFCTSEGISRYDGKSFTNFTIKQGLPSNEVISSKDDKDGNIWFGTTAGVCQYKIDQSCNKNTCIHNLQLPIELEEHNKELSKAFTNFSTLTGLSNNNITCIQEDSCGILYFGTFGGGLNLFNKKKINQLCYTKACKHNFQNKQELKEHNHQLALAFTNFSTEQGLICNSISAITVDKNGHIWLATPKGASCYDGIKFNDFTVKNGLSCNMVTSITEDKSGNLWFGTFGGGINTYKGKSFINYISNQASNSDLISSILEDSCGVMWLASYSNGLLRYDGNFFTTFNPTQILQYAYANNLVIDKSGRLWYGLLGSGVCFYDKNKITNYTTLHGLVNNTVFYSTKDKKGNLWFATELGVSCYDGKNFINYTEKQGLVCNYVNCIYEDNKANIWFGTQNGLSCYNGKYFTNFKKEKGSGCNNIYAIVEDKYNNLWLATENGLSRFDGKSFLNYTTLQGLPNNSITQILISKQQHVVLGTNDGLGILTSFCIINNNTKTKRKEMQETNASIPVISKLSNNQLKKLQPNIEIYNSKNGYPVNDVNGGCNSMYLDKKGVIWAGTGSIKTGLVRFDYNALNKTYNPLKIVLQTLKINNEGVNWYNLNANNESDILKSQHEMLVLGKVLTEKQRADEKIKFKNITFDSISRFYHVPQNLTVPFKNNTISFEYAAVEPASASPYLIKYQYMLEGYDDDWQPVTNKTEVSYGNLNEGNYKFKVKAAINQHFWNTPITYKFTVLPPYYRTWWAYGVYAIGFMGIVYGYSMWRNKKIKKITKLIIKKQDEEKYRISRDLHDDLGQALSFLKMNTEQKNKSHVDVLLNKVRAISYNLSPVKLIDSSIKDLLIELIIEAEKSDVFFSYEIENIPIKDNDLKINLYRIAQEAINNLIKHAKAKNAKIALTEMDSMLFLEIQDDGIGMTQGNINTTIGLSSMKERSDVIGANFSIKDTNKGTHIVVKLKLAHA
jgi:ligand-binding sensor domain-containing protein/two-component sensor histidine kinase